MCVCICVCIERERIFHSLVHAPNGWLGLGQADPGTRIVCFLGRRGPSTCIIFRCFLRHTTGELDQEKQEFEPVPTRDASVASTTEIESPILVSISLIARFEFLLQLPFLSFVQAIFLLPVLFLIPKDSLCIFWYKVFIYISYKHILIHDLSPLILRISVL